MDKFDLTDIIDTAELNKLRAQASLDWMNDQPKVCYMKDTESPELADEFYFTDMKMNKWFRWSITDYLSLQQATYQVGLLLKQLDNEHFTVRADGYGVLYDGKFCLSGWYVSQDATILRPYTHHGLLRFESKKKTITVERNEYGYQVY